MSGALDRVELAAAAAFLTCFLGGLMGLATLWLALSSLPPLMSQIGRPEAMVLCTLSGGALAGALGMVLLSRRILVAEWAPLVGVLRGANVKPLHIWIIGPGPLITFSSALLPIAGAALLAISPWLVVPLAGACYYVISHLVTATGAVASWKAVRRDNRHVPVTASRRSLLCPALTYFILATVGLFAFLLSLDFLSPALTLATRTQVSLISRLIEQRDTEYPELEDLYRQRIAIEREAYDRALGQVRAGKLEASQEMQDRHSRLLALESELAKLRLENLGEIGRLTRELEDARARLRALSSAAPALAGH
jgi:hypothetical protein